MGTTATRRRSSRLRRTATVSAATGAILLGSAAAAGAAFASTGTGLSPTSVGGVTDVVSSTTSSATDTLSTAVGTAVDTGSSTLSSTTGTLAGTAPAITSVSPSPSVSASPIPTPPLPAPLNQVVSTVTGLLSSAAPLPPPALPNPLGGGSPLPSPNPAGGSNPLPQTNPTTTHAQLPAAAHPPVTLAQPPATPPAELGNELALLHDVPSLADWSFTGGVLSTLAPDVSMPPMLPPDMATLAAGQSPKLASRQDAALTVPSLPGVPGLPILAVIGATLAVGLSAAAHVGALQQRLGRRRTATA